MRRSIPALLTCLLFVFAASTARATADTLIAETRRVGPIDVQGKRVVWSDVDPQMGGHVLWTKFGERPAERIRVPARSGGPFDLDLGHDADGREVLAYSRCAPGGRCRIHTYSFRSRRETLASPQRVHETLPAVWGGRVAFVRTLSGGRKAIYVRPLTGGAPVRVPGAETAEGALGPTALDFDGTRVAYVWQVDSGEDNQWELLMARPGAARATFIEWVTSGAMSEARLLGADIAADAIWTAQAREAAAGNRIVRHSLRGGRVTRTPAGRHMRAFSAGNGTPHALYATSGEDFGSCASTYPGAPAGSCRLLREG